ncbi:MAG: hypothetical protein R3B70_46720 [Polyangiaceae bacterium]
MAKNHRWASSAILALGLITSATGIARAELGKQGLSPQGLSPQG